jgi:alpha-N-acetylglucosamine transferase
MNAVVTIALGPEFQQMAAMTAPLIAGYARRLGADFLQIGQPSTSPHFEKFQLHHLLLKYERVIYLDADLIVNDHCPDLFALVPADRFGAWFPSRMGPGFEAVIAQAQAALGDIGWNTDYFNSGVMVVSRCHREMFAPPYNYLDGFFEQTLLNYRVQKLRFPVTDIGWQCNHTGRVRTPNGWLGSHIIHYAGLGHTPGVSRIDQIRRDLKLLGKP